ncbi:unnamed protein product [Medioppia subpectinata]|uniref:Uncharacterized protein n=1 Tax=Medioppia subpectinata TaxID=1979941 RepID=A0A7R9KZR4_9ACAR|nr:unnamed protein product [Medioppia subpectinata]CAG2112670.1 unnamed protein product [Medioppia subpectinata]
MASVVLLVGLCVDNRKMLIPWMLAVSITTTLDLLVCCFFINDKETRCRNNNDFVLLSPNFLYKPKDSRQHNTVEEVSESTRTTSHINSNVGLNSGVVTDKTKGGDNILNYKLICFKTGDNNCTDVKNDISSQNRCLTQTNLHSNNSDNNTDPRDKVYGQQIYSTI